MYGKLFSRVTFALKINDLSRNGLVHELRKILSFLRLFFNWFNKFTPNVMMPSCKSDWAIIEMHITMYYVLCVNVMITLLSLIDRHLNCKLYN